MPQVPCVEPAISEYLRGCIRVLPVTEHHVRTADTNFPDLHGDCRATGT